MLARFAAVVTLALVLSGCVLKSPAPLFPDSRAEPILGAETIALRAFERDRDGRWTPAHPEDKPTQFQLQGRHYIASQPGETQTYPVAFVALGGGWYVAQMTDEDHSAAYALVKPEGGEFLARWLSCERLKTNARRAAIAFKGSDCVIRPTADPLALFRALRDTPGEADMKYLRAP